jgi:hypothetical protein
MIGGILASLIPSTLFASKIKGDLRLGVTSNPGSFKIKGNGNVGLGCPNPTGVLHLPKFKVGDNVEIEMPYRQKLKGKVVGFFHSSDDYATRDNYDKALKTVYPWWDGGYLYNVWEDGGVGIFLQEQLTKVS